MRLSFRVRDHERGIGMLRITLLGVEPKLKYDVFIQVKGMKVIISSSGNPPSPRRTSLPSSRSSPFPRPLVMDSRIPRTQHPRHPSKVFLNVFISPVLQKRSSSLLPPFRSLQNPSSGRSVSQRIQSQRRPSCRKSMSLWRLFTVE